MRRLYPSTHLLRAFVTVAQHMNISRAAEELHLTQSAVSKQILELESSLGVDLFERVRKRLVLSPAGQRYAASMVPLLKQLEAATLEVIAHGQEGGALHVSCLPTFAAKWLIPRIAKFQQLHPKVTVHFVPFSQGYDFSLPELDCAIRYGQGTWPAAQAEYLTGKEMVLIAPPTLSGNQRIRKPADVQKHNLLQHTTVTGAWLHWCEAHRVPHPNPLAGSKFDQYNALVRAVMAGLGLALIPRCLVQDDIDSGIVAAPLDEVFEWNYGYFLCFPDAKAHIPALDVFRQWLAQECAH
jgi:LysR family transcriptional regulator, glycine cleavage system transcriptional activator